MPGGSAIWRRFLAEEFELARPVPGCALSADRMSVVKGPGE
jgi:hypothetical protein